MQGKYVALTLWLAADAGRTVSLTFQQMDELVGDLPRSARAHRAWWGNERDGRHVQAAAWRGAGFEVSAVELGHHVVFSRFRRPLARMNLDGIEGDEPVVRGVLALRNGDVVADEGARWLTEDFVAILPDGNLTRRVRPRHGEAFLVACWFSLVGAYTGGTLIGEDGHPFTREEGLALVDSYAGVGDHYGDRETET